MSEVNRTNKVEKDNRDIAISPLESMHMLGEIYRDKDITINYCAISDDANIPYGFIIRRGKEILGKYELSRK